METTMKTRESAVSAPTAGVAPQKLRRRPLLVVLAVALVAGGAALGVWLWMSATSASEVVTVRGDVDRGRVITVADLGTVRVALDPSLQAVPGSELETLVGKRAAVDLRAGTLLAPSDVTDELPPAAGVWVVCMAVGPGMMPAVPLRPGDAVRLVQTPGQAGEVTGAPATVNATVLGVTAGDTVTVVDVLVPADKAPELAARSATGKVAIVLDARER